MDSSSTNDEYGPEDMMIVSSTGASLALLNTKKIKDDKQRRVAFRLDGQRPTKYVLPSDSEEN